MTAPRSIVRAGLKPGDRVIVNPPVDLTDGMRVAAADVSAPATAETQPMMRVSAAREK